MGYIILPLASRCTWSAFILDPFQKLQWRPEITILSVSTKSLNILAFFSLNWNGIKIVEQRGDWKKLTQRRCASALDLGRKNE